MVYPFWHPFACTPRPGRPDRIPNRSHSSWKNRFEKCLFLHLLQIYTLLCGELVSQARLGGWLDKRSRTRAHTQCSVLDDVWLGEPYLTSPDDINLVGRDTCWRLIEWSSGIKSKRSNKRAAAISACFPVCWVIVCVGCPVNFLLNASGSSLTLQRPFDKYVGMWCVKYAGGQKMNDCADPSGQDLEAEGSAYELLKTFIWIYSGWMKNLGGREDVGVQSCWKIGSSEINAVNF